MVLIAMFIDRLGPYMQNPILLMKNRRFNINEAVGVLIDKLVTVFNVSIDIMSEQENDVRLNL